jgi:translation initiation factor 2 beta subunit (eIF-2beta)/eIF-5
MSYKDLRNERLKHIQLASASKNAKSKNWQPEEDIELRLAQEIGLTIAQTVECMNEDDKLNYRCYTRRSIEARRIRLKLGKPIKSLMDEGSAMSNKYILKEVDQTLVEYFNALSMIVRCNKCNYEWVKEARALGNGCPKCAKGFVGGMPVGPEPALVYLLIFSEWNKCKVGYCEIGVSSSPEEAIHKTSQYRNYPYPYIIGAYDLSTKTEAGILEQTLLKNTFDSRAFIETQEFGGYTEFRNIKVLKQLLPEYKTVLDTAFRI